MGKEALEANAKEIPQFLAQCRAGEAGIGNNGYHLWLHGDIFTREGGDLATFGTSVEEVRTFLVTNLKGWVEGMQGWTTDTDNASSQWTIMSAYFVPTEANDEAADDPEVFEQLGITVEEFHGLSHILDVRRARIELERCRIDGPSPKFYGLLSNVLTGKTSLEEIGTTPEEFAAFSEQYRQTHSTSYDYLQAVVASNT